MISDLEDENNTSRIVTITVLAGISLLLLVFFIKGKSDEQKVKEDYAITTGWIKKYFDTSKSVEGVGIDITYEYKVDGRTYTRTVHNDRKILGCDDKVDAICMSKRFHVLYSKKSVQLSLIYLESEAQFISQDSVHKLIEHFY
jgi:hypothetical protein